MAKCINTIINEDVSAAGIRNATDAKVYNRNNKGDITFADSFLDSIESATLKLRRTDCSQVVLDYFSSKFPAATGAVKSGYDWASENSAIEAGMQKVSGALSKVANSVGFDPESLAKSFCVTVTTASRTLIFYLDIATKSAFVLFKKIEALKAKIEKALLEFSSEVRDCIVSVIVDAKNAINKVVNNILDFDVVIDLMNHCPCITDIVASMFNCKEDENGNRLTTPEQVMRCVQEKFSLDPSKILGAVNNFIDNTLIDTLDRGFNMIDEMIKNIMETLMLPLRELMKMYCALLTEKINLTSFIKALGPADCLLIYTTERDDDGKEYLGMSLIDIINTFKLWANCFEYVCESFVDDMSTTIKKLNEDLRLDDKYWRDVMLIDLYQSCIAVKVQAQQPRPSMIRELFVKQADGGKGVFINIVDAFKQVGKIETKRDDYPAEKNVTPIADSINFKDGPDNEDLPIQQGRVKFARAVEDSIMSILRNIGTSVDKNIYFERFLQLVTWEGKFIKSNDHIQLIESIDKKSKESTSTNITSREISTVVDTSDSDRVTDPYYNAQNPFVQSFPVPDYELENDYDYNDIESIISYKVPTKQKEESLKTYYGRWYAGAIA